MTAIHQLSAVELAAAIRTGQIRAVEAVAAAFQQMARWNDRLKAVITPCQEQAMAAAEQADRAVERGERLGPLHGVPFTAKDLTPTAGVRTTYGSLIYRDHVPSRDELCIERLRTAGAILIGKTNTPEFGMGAHTHNRLYGPTATPYAIDRSAGGSSGGAGAAIAVGIGQLAQGTDMGGSVRIPASFCDVVGLRPSAGRIPRRRRPDTWDYLDTDGVITRTVEDAALMLSVMAGGDRQGMISPEQPLWEMPEFSDAVCSRLAGQIRLGFSPDLGVAVVDRSVESVFRAAIEQLTPLCRSVKAAHPDCSLAQWSFETARAALLWEKQQHHYNKHRNLLSPSVIWNIERGQDISEADLMIAEADQEQVFLNFLQFFEQYDVLATVSACVPPFLHTQTEILQVNGRPLRHIIDYLSITYIISLTGLPALSIPCGWTEEGLPIGMQLIGKPQGEAELLQFAYLLQEKLNFRHRWPSDRELQPSTL